MGQERQALDGVRILDFTHVQSESDVHAAARLHGRGLHQGGASGHGRHHLGQLRDIKGVDSLYFTMLNGNKRSITVDSKHPKGKEIIERLIKTCDVLVENFAPARSIAWGSRGSASTS